jgi:hypothetical protein
LLTVEKVVESIHMATPSPQSLSDCYDMSTLIGRLRYSWSIFSPLNLRLGQAAVDEANATLADPSASYGQRQQALTVRAACAPAGELLPWPVRACGWALGGTPIIAFMVSNARHYPNSLLRIFLGQLLNQSHLAGATYCNRGVSAGGADVAAIAKAYVVSISTAVPIAFVAAVSAQRWTVLRPLARYAPYPGVAAANALACVTMRQADVADGIPVFGSAAGAPAEQLGTSRVAGWAAVRDTALTRLCMPVGNFLIVPSLLYALQRPNRALGFGPQIAVTASIFCCWLPFSASLFPPTGTLPVTALEEELRAHLERAGVREVSYSRGV